MQDCLEEVGFLVLEDRRNRGAHCVLWTQRLWAIRVDPTPDPDLQAYLPPFSLRHQSASAIHPSIHQPSVSLRMMVAVVKMKQERAQSSTKPTQPIWRNGER